VGARGCLPRGRLRARGRRSPPKPPPFVCSGQLAAGSSAGSGFRVNLSVRFIPGFRLQPPLSRSSHQTMPGVPYNSKAGSINKRRSISIFGSGERRTVRSKRASRRDKNQSRRGFSWWPFGNGSKPVKTVVVVKAEATEAEVDKEKPFSRLAPGSPGALPLDPPV
jgi:hypothetical protein